MVYLFCWFSQEAAPHFVDSLNSYSCFHLVDFVPEFDYFLPSTPLGWICFLFSRAFRCVVKLLMCALSTFFLEALRAMSFLLGTVFFVSHKMGYVLASFSLNSKKSLISLFFPWPYYHWVECCSASTWMVAFYCLCCFWRSALVSGDVIECMG